MEFEEIAMRIVVAVVTLAVMAYLAYLGYRLLADAGDYNKEHNKIQALVRSLFAALIFCATILVGCQFWWIQLLAPLRKEWFGH